MSNPNQTQQASGQQQGRPQEGPRPQQGGNGHHGNQQQTNNRLPQQSGQQPGQQPQQQQPKDKAPVPQVHDGFYTIGDRMIHRDLFLAVIRFIGRLQVITLIGGGTTVLVAWISALVLLMSAVSTGGTVLQAIAAVGVFAFGCVVGGFANAITVFCGRCVRKVG